MDDNSTGTVLNLKLDNPNIVAGDIYVQGITFTNGNASIGGGLIAQTASPSRIDIIDCIIE